MIEGYTVALLILPQYKVRNWRQTLFRVASQKNLTPGPCGRMLDHPSLVFEQVTSSWRERENRTRKVFSDSKTIFGDPKTGFFLPKTFFFPTQNRFLVNSKPVLFDPKPVFGQLKTGFFRPQNRFWANSKPVFSYPKPGFGDLRTGFCRIKNRCFPTPKPGSSSSTMEEWRRVFICSASFECRNIYLQRLFHCMAEAAQ